MQLFKGFQVVEFDARKKALFMAQISRPKPPGESGNSLGRTRQKSIQLTGDDGVVFSATVYTCVNLTRDPQLRTPLMQGVLNEVSAPGDDQRTYHLAIPVVIHDEEEELFALLIPEGLRHREFQCRRQLLEKMASCDDIIPAYMRRFEVLFDISQWESLSAAQETDENVDETPAAPVPSEPLEEERRQLEVDREQLEEVASRVERDSARVDEARNEIEQERAELEQLRQEVEEEKRKLQVQELNLEQERLRLQNDGGDDEKPHANESTQVVTDDQFIEVVEEEDEEPQNISSGEMMVPSTDIIDARPRRPQPTSRTFKVCDRDDIFESFSEAEPNPEKDWFLADMKDLVLVGYRVDAELVETFEGGNLEFLFQVHNVDGVPIIGLTLACFDDDGECLEAVTAPLTDQAEYERSLLDKIARDLHVHIALYTGDGERVGCWEAGAPMRRNIGWARQRLRKWRDNATDVDEARGAAERLASGNVELVGSMRHPFETQGFSEFHGASDVKLAVGIVGYWSRPEQFDYLIGNRSFSLEQFLDIQKRVVRQALHWGIAPGRALSQLAIDESIILDRASMTQRLLTNFAEVCVGLRPNDLDPIEQWENWDALIQLAKDHAITPDPDVLELAEVSLNRAEKYEESLDDEPVDEPNGSAASADGVPEPEELGAGYVKSMTAVHRSQRSGVTYFFPTDQIDEDVGELESLDRQSLGALLDDPQRNLAAAQVLLEKSGPRAIVEVLAVADELTQPEVAALARFTGARADGLEGALMQVLDSAGSSATFVIAWALASIGSTAALPRLLDAMRDPRRGEARDALAGCLALFGDRLVPPLARALKESPSDDDLLAVLAALEDVRQGTLEELERDRNQELQQAVRRVRQLV